MKYSQATSLRIVVAGYIVGGPLGGLVWHHLQYVIGLHNMGHDVLFIEDSDEYPSCYNPDTNEMSADPSYGLRFIESVFTDFKLNDKWAYYHAHSGEWYGRSKGEVMDFSRSADLFLNLSGINPVKEFLQKIPVRVFIDTDPVFTQIRHLTETSAMQSAQMHNRFFSFGENFGKNNCTIPDDDFNWQPTRQPVVTELWKPFPGDQNNSWTTVMQWDSYKVREYNGRTFGMKSVSFDPYIRLPKVVADPIELAIGSETAPKEMLLREGWQISNPLLVTRTHESYQQYILSSKGEWSVAKQGYVNTQSGWFSERSCCYLASGRPVVVQDTGFSDFIETGNGLLGFTNLDEAKVSIEEVNRNYKKHCEDARSVAKRYFNHKDVLNKLLDACFTSGKMVH